MNKNIIDSIKDGNIIQIFDEHRALILLVLLFAVMSLVAPNFFNRYNVTTILTGMSLNAIVAIGFTLVFIIGQLDLSVGAVVMFCGMLVIGFQPDFGWAISFILAVSVGSLIGFINGILVAKVKIHSFIVTLGAMIILEGAMHLYSGGGSVFTSDFGPADWLETSVIPMFPPIVIITFILIFGSAFILNKTRFGKGFFLVGANPESAWLAGLNKDFYIIIGFVISGAMSATAGALFAIRMASMTAGAVLGMRTLMTVLAAVIIGGTSMSGGQGSIVKSFFGVLLLTVLFNGIGNLGMGFEVQIFLNGLILAAVVLYEAYAQYRYKLLKGQRPYLLEELDN